MNLQVSTQLKFYNQLLLLYLQMLKLNLSTPTGISSRWFLSFSVSDPSVLLIPSCTFLSSGSSHISESPYVLSIVGNIWK